MSSPTIETRAPDLREYAASLWARRWEIVAVTAVCLLGALIYAFTATPVYRATTRVLVNSTVSSPTQAQAPLPPDMQNEQAIAGSLKIASITVKSANLRMSASALEQHVTVTVAPNTNILLIAYTDTNRLTAANVANDIANAYISFRTSQSLDKLRRTESAITSQVGGMQRQLRGLDAQLARPTTPALVASIQSQRDSLVSRLTVMQARLADVDAAIQTNSSPAVVVANALIPRAPVSPNKTRDAALGLIAGLALGGGFALVRERLDDRIKSRDEIERRVGAPVLAAIPRLRGWRHSADTPLAMITDRQGPVAEAYRTLGTNVRYLATQRPLKVIMLTSSLPGEGKSTTAANLAVALARAGRRVILVSADLRRPRVHRFFDVEDESGLSDALLDHTDIFKLVRDPGVENLRLLTGGPAPSDPADLLAGGHLGTVVDALREAADFVVIDTPPVLAVADASIMAPLTDGTVFVVDAEASSRSSMHQARLQLENSGVRILGAVYNRFDVTGGDAPYASYYTATAERPAGAPPADPVVQRRRQRGAPSEEPAEVLEP